MGGSAKCFGTRNFEGIERVLAPPKDELRRSLAELLAVEEIETPAARCARVPSHGTAPGVKQRDACGALKTFHETAETVLIPIPDLVNDELKLGKHQAGTEQTIA